MASGFNGDLLMLGGDVFPAKWMKAETYKATTHVMDLDSTRSQTGKLQRNVLEHTSGDISFETPPMWNDEFAEMWAFIRKHYIGSKVQKTVNCTYFDPEWNEYKSGKFYVPDVEHNMDLLDRKHKRIMMMSETIQFIQY